MENLDRLNGKRRLLIAHLCNESCLISHPGFSTQHSNRNPQTDKPAGCEMSQQQQSFKILEVQTREYSRFNMRGTQWKARLYAPSVSETTPQPHPVSHFVDSVNVLLDYLLEDADMVGITIHNVANQIDTPICFSFRRNN